MKKMEKIYCDDSQNEKITFLVSIPFEVTIDDIELNYPNANFSRCFLKCRFNEKNKNISKTAIALSDIFDDYEVEIDEMSYALMIKVNERKIILDSTPRDVLYKLEKFTQLLPNQTVRFIQSLEEQIGVNLPHFLTPEEVNEFLKESK